MYIYVVLPCAKFAFYFLVSYTYSQTSPIAPSNIETLNSSAIIDLIHKI